MSDNPTSLPAVKGIIFDLDGTLYHMKWYMKALITLRLFPHCLRLPAYMSVREAFAGKDMGSGEKLMTELSEGLSKRIRTSQSDARAWIHNGFYRQFEAVMPLMRTRRGGLGHWLISLREKRVKLAVLSDYARIPERLARLGLDIALFDQTASSEQAGALKPCARPLIEIARTWGLPPEQILMVGDREDTDGEAARSAGMQFVRISDKANPSAGGLPWPDILFYINELVADSSELCINFRHETRK